MFNLPIFGTFLLFADSLLYIFGKEFTTGAAGLIVLAGAALFNATTGTCGTVINMTGHSRLSLVNSIIYLGSSIVIDLLLICRWQLIGAAWAGALTIVINNTLNVPREADAVNTWAQERNLYMGVTTWGISPIVAECSDMYLNKIG